MNTIPKIPLKTKLFPIGIVLICVMIQWLFMADCPKWAIVVFGVVTLVILFSNRNIWSFPETGRKNRNSWLPWLLWITAILIRMHYVVLHYSIQDLSARFTVTAIEISRGNPVFPFIPQYEYDESLVSWFFAPFLLLLGHAWLTVKMISIILSTSLVPTSFYYVRRIIDTRAAFLVSLAVMSSHFFHYTDPMVDMSRFSLVTVFILLSLISLDHVFSSSKPYAWSVLAGLLTVLPAYIHSIGRVNLVIVIIFIASRFIQNKQILQWNKIKTRIYLVSCIAIFLLIPLMLFIWKTPGYLDFKRRQIYGFHESFPFSWAGLYQSFYDVLTSFHCKSGRHMFFPSDQPLLQPIIAVGVIGGLWLLIKNIRRSHFATLLSAVFLLTVSLAFITPGLWRCLYFSPSIAMLTIVAGIFYFWCVERLVGMKNNKISASVLIAVSIIIAIAQVPGFFKQPFPPPKLNISTLLYKDLSEAPDVPHFISGSIPEILPGFAICDLIGSAWLTEYAVLYFEPVQLKTQRGIIWDSSEELFENEEIRLVLTQEDTNHIPVLENIFGPFDISELPNSSLILGVVKKQ